MKISVNIPSYKRPKVKTLDFFPNCKVWVSEAEADAYREQNPGAEIVPLKKSEQGNISRVRNTILRREFKAGADVVCFMDDDLKGIYSFEKAEDSLFGYEQYLVTDFMDFLRVHSTMAIDMGAYLWGVNLNYDKRGYNHFNPISTNSIILGPFSCHIKGSGIFYDERIPLKEDYDLAIQHLNKYRKILRLNKYHYSCKQSEQSGGCAAVRNYTSEKEQFELLQRKWGSRIVRQDKSSRKAFDYNPIIKIPIPGV